ncbi:MAG: hypothetical protein JNJ46_02735 [Myxococcales bacterium]|nr:hypothetical protein [Myxococcales bacterium]
MLPQDVSATRREILAALSVQETNVWRARPDLVFFCTLWGIELELDVSSLALSTLSGFRVALVFLLSYTPLRDMGLRFLNQAAQRNPPSGLLAVDLLCVAAMVNLNAGRLPAAAEAAQQAVTQARSIKDDLAMLRSLLPLQLARIANEECAAALDVSREMETLTVRTQNPHFLALSLMGQSVVWLRYGEFEKTEEMLKRTLASLPVEMGPVPESVARGLSASCALMQGQLALAEERAAQTVETIKSI